MVKYIDKNAVFELIRSMPSVDMFLPSKFKKRLYELPAADVIDASKLTPEAKLLIETLPEAVNLLVQKMNDALDKLIINGAKEDTPTGILAARADKEGGADNG